VGSELERAHPGEHRPVRRQDLTHQHDIAGVSGGYEVVRIEKPTALANGIPERSLLPVQHTVRPTVQIVGRLDDERVGAGTLIRADKADDQRGALRDLHHPPLYQPGKPRGTLEPILMKTTT